MTRRAATENHDEQIRTILRPLMRDSRGRSGRLARAFGDYEGLIGLIEVDGSPTDFLDHLIGKLREYGETERGKPALCVLLESVKGEVGADKKSLITKIIRVERSRSVGPPSDEQAAQQAAPAAPVIVQATAAATAPISAVVARDLAGDVRHVKNPDLLRAIRNIAELGDTDVCPYPPDKHIFWLLERQSLEALTKLCDDASRLLDDVPPDNETLLCQIGYTGFRWVTQLDPLWNAYFLGLCLSVGELIENARIPRSDRTIFSYRFQFDDETQQMFDPTIGWPEFVERSSELSHSYSYIIRCDIADFYHRIPHDSLIRALESCNVPLSARDRLKEFLEKGFPGPGIGLPIGGPASRLFSKALLNQTDQVLVDKGIPFCRFADDYHIFAPTLDVAYSRLILLSELLQHHGMTLQKLKTRIFTQREFQSSAATVGRPGASDDEEIARFLTIRLRYDPYDDNAKENYDRLAEEVQSYNILGMLTREMAKSRINEVVTRRLTKAVRFLQPDPRDAAIRKLISKENAALIAPVFPTALVLVRDIFETLSDELQGYVLSELSLLYDQAAPILRLDLNIAFWLRILSRASGSQVSSARKQCVRLYDDRANKLVRRDAILAIADLGGRSWILTMISRYNDMSVWERRALIAVSHILGEKGTTWRRSVARRVDEAGRLYSDWGAVVHKVGQRFL
jgi:hypothetical protein